MVPFDDRSPFVTSGIRIGTAAVTTRGFREGDMDFVAEKLDQVVMNTANEGALATIADEIKAYCSRFPLYTDLDA